MTPVRTCAAFVLLAPTLTAQAYLEPGQPDVLVAAWRRNNDKVSLIPVLKGCG